MLIFAQAIVTGIFAGFICGLFGMGGGSLIVPAVYHVFSLSLKEAIGTSLLIIIFSSLSAIVNYLRSNKVRLNLVVFIVPSGILGAQAGSFLTSRLPEEIVRYVFILLVVSLGLKMLFQPEHDGAGDENDRNFNRVYAVLIGLFAGFVSGLCGVGGAVLIIPLLYIFLKVSIHSCIGTALIAIFFNSVSGSIGYMVRGLVNFRIGLMVAAGSTVAAPLGAKLSINTSRVKIRRMFSVILILSGISILFR